MVVSISKPGATVSRIAHAAPDDLGLVGPDYVLGTFSLLVYGDIGVGKTRFLGQAVDIPEMQPVLWLDPERGTRTIADRKGVKVKKVLRMKDVLDVVAWIEKHGYFKTVVIDSLTSLYSRLLLERLATGESKQYDPFVPSQQDYQVVTFRIRHILWQLTTLEVNLLASAQLRTVEDETAMALISGTSGADQASIPLLIVPAVTGQLAREVGGYFDFVARMYTKSVGQKVTRLLQFQPYGRAIAKARATPDNELPATLTDPTMRQLWEYVSKGVPIKDEAEAADAIGVDEDLAQAGDESAMSAE